MPLRDVCGNRSRGAPTRFAAICRFQRPLMRLSRKVTNVAHPDELARARRLSVSQSCAATTNASGVASCSVVLNQTAGNYTMTASFGGIFGADAGTSNPVPFVITQEETTLSYTGDIVVANSRENLKLLLS